MHQYTAEPPAGFTHPLARFIVKRLSRPFNRAASGIGSCIIENGDHAREAFAAFRKGETKLIIPFRHVGRMDPPLLGEVFGTLLEKEHPLENCGKDPYWVHFLHGKMVLQWAGPLARWAFPKIGAIPVSNQLVDKTLIALLKNTVLEGVNPICFAPEGQVTYYRHRTAELAAGMGHFLKWNARKKNTVAILPVDIRYAYPESKELPAKLLSKLKSELDALEGSASPANEDAADATAIKTQETRLWGFLGKALNISNVDDLIPVLFRRCEFQMSLTGEGSDIQRLMRLRGSVFNTMLSREIPVKEMADGIAEAIAGKIALDPFYDCYRCMQLLDVLVFYERDFLDTHREPDDYSLQLLNLLDICNRYRGGDIDSRYHPPNQRAFVRFGKSYVEEDHGNPGAALDRLRREFESLLD